MYPVELIKLYRNSEYFSLNPKVSNFDPKAGQFDAVEKAVVNNVTTTLKIATRFKSSYVYINCFPH